MTRGGRWLRIVGLLAFAGCSPHLTSSADEDSGQKTFDAGPSKLDGGQPALDAGASDAEGFLSGTVSNNGASVSVPAGALPQPTDVAITPVNPPAPFPEDQELVGEVYALTPHGLTFASPVQLSLPAPTTATDLVVMQLDGPQDTVWKVAAQATFLNGVAAVPLAHFSYYGVFRKIDPCALNNGGCDAHASCSIVNHKHVCACDPGYEGDGVTCQSVDECTNGTSGCDLNATCTSTPGSYACACNAGYSGDGHTCTFVSQCGAGNSGCGGNATCTGNATSIACACSSGFAGDGYTCLNESDCAVDNGACFPGASCTTTGSGTIASCTCPLGFIGDGRTCALATSSTQVSYPWSAPLPPGVRGFAFDGGQHFYATGSTTTALQPGVASFGGEDVFLQQYTMSGALQWTRQIGTPANDSGAAVTVDSDGAVYVAGSAGAGLGAAANAGGGFVAKFDATGTLQWVWENPSTTEYSLAAIAVDGHGAIYVSGQTSAA